VWTVAAVGVPLTACMQDFAQNRGFFTPTMITLLVTLYTERGTLISIDMLDPNLRTRLVSTPGGSTATATDNVEKMSIRRRLFLQPV